MNKKIGEFLKELFGDKKFSYIYDYESNMIYFKPQEVFENCELKEQTIRAKIMKIPSEHKKTFNKKVLESGNFGVDLKSTLNNNSENWVTIYGMIKALQGKNKKANEIVDWLIFEVLPQIMEKGGYIDESATDEQLLALQKEIDERVKQAKLEERNRRVFTAQQICNRIKVPNLTCESLFVYLQSYKLGTIIYNDDGSIKKFKHNNKFKENFIQNGYGYAREGNNGFLDFYKEFAERVNKSPKALESLKFINENKDEQLEF